jgi:hypothetical protein
MAALHRWKHEANPHIPLGRAGSLELFPLAIKV